jgi:hypothetical protein
MFDRKKRLAMLDTVQPTSKSSLKLQCLNIAKGDIKEAKELYEYLSADIDLPDFDPVKPTFLQSTKNAADGILGWIKENKDALIEGYEFIKGFRPGKPSPGAPLPPIN